MERVFERLIAKTVARNTFNSPAAIARHSDATWSYNDYRIVSIDVAARENQAGDQTLSNRSLELVLVSVAGPSDRDIDGLAERRERIDDRRAVSQFELKRSLAVGGLTRNTYVVGARMFDLPVEAG